MPQNQEKDVFLQIYRDLKAYGAVSEPRQKKILELENYSYELPPYARFTNFEARNFSLDYAKREFLWYLRGDRKDVSICDYASIWKDLVDDSGVINSNYGAYIFQQKQFQRVHQILSDDKDSRRGSMMILDSDHVLSETNDLPCTYSINFRIRANRLNMTVHMRSQDAIYGMTNDAVAFSFMHEMMFASLLREYPTLELGVYRHFADSFHVYEKHFEMLDRLLVSDFSSITCPRISGPDEVDFLLSGEFSSTPVRFEFTTWLHDNTRLLFPPKIAPAVSR